MQSSLVGAWFVCCSIFVSFSPVYAASDTASSEDSWHPPHYPGSSIILENKGASPRLLSVSERYQLQKKLEFDGFRLDAIDSWEHAVKLGEEMESPSQLVSFNARLNQVPYRSRRNTIADLQWPTPLEFIASGGECIGYAVAKFLALKESGWLSSTTLIVVGRLLDDTPHAVVVVRSLDDSDWFQLDNRTDTIIPTEHVTEFIPFFVLSDTFIWIYKHDKSGSPAPTLDRRGRP